MLVAIGKWSESAELRELRKKFPPKTGQPKLFVIRRSRVIYRTANETKRVSWVEERWGWTS